MAVPRSRIWWATIVVVVMGVLALALWLDLRRIPPSFTIINFSMPTSAGSSRQHGQPPDIFVNLRMKNPNRVYSLTYDYIDLTFNYTQGTLGKTTIPKFHQPKKKQKFMVPSHVKADVHQLEAVQKAISNSKEGKAKLKVELRTGVRYQNLGSTSKELKFKFQGQFYVGSDGKIAGNKEVKLCKGLSC